jgi:hypothetical protein
MKIILFNGPKNTGKTVATLACMSKLGSLGYSVSNVEFKDELIKATAEHFGLDLEIMLDMLKDRTKKEVWNSCFKEPLSDEPLERKRQEDFLASLGLGYQITSTPHAEQSSSCSKHVALLSPRAALIYTSEYLLKPKFGVSYFAEKVIEKLSSEPESDLFRVNIESSCGFDEECKRILEEYGEDNVLLLQIHSDRGDYNGDSRGYVDKDMFKYSREVFNYGSEDSFLEQLENYVVMFCEDELV